MTFQTHQSFVFALLVLGVVPNNARGDVYAVENILVHSAPLVTAIDQSCTKFELGQQLSKFSLRDFTPLETDIGSINEFGTTTHIYSTYSSSAGLQGIVVSYGQVGEGSNCRALVVIATKGAHLKIKSSFYNGKFSQNLSNLELAEMAEQVKRCEQLGADAPKYYRDGSYFITSDGGVLKDYIPFDCNIAVPNNASSINVKVGREIFRISVVYDKVFLLEVK